MRLQGGKQGAALAAAITKDLRHRQPGVVVEHRHRYAAEEGKCRHMTLAEGLGGLGRIGLHEDRITVGQRDNEKVHLPGHPANHRPGLAKIRLGVTRRMRQGHEGLLQAQAAGMDIIAHRRIAAVKAALGAQTIVNPLDRVTLLLRCAQVIRQDLLDEADVPIKLRTAWPHAPPITRRRRMRHHLRHRPAIYPKTPSRFSLAQTLAQNRQPNTPVQIHTEHPPPPTNQTVRDLDLAGF